MRRMSRSQRPSEKSLVSTALGPARAIPQIAVGAHAGAPARRCRQREPDARVRRSIESRRDEGRDALLRRLRAFASTLKGCKLPTDPGGCVDDEAMAWCGRRRDGRGGGDGCDARITAGSGERTGYTRCGGLAEVWM